MSQCPVCKAAENKGFPVYYIFNNKEFSARKCISCGFVFIDPRLTEDELKLLYSDEYFLYDGADFGAHSSTDYEKAAVLGSVKFPEIMDKIKRFKPNGQFFEIGCAMGYFLDYVRKEGYEVGGIEFSELGAKKCRDKFKLNVECSSFESYNNPGDVYDVVFMGDVLEHLVNPLEMLLKAGKMLKPSGIIALEVPSTFNSITGRCAVNFLWLLGKRRKMPMPPYHINEFTPITLEKTLKLAGFKNIYIFQRIKSPKSITLRGNKIEKAIKKSLQYPNYYITKSLGIYGDRLLAIGIK